MMNERKNDVLCVTENEIAGERGREGEGREGGRQAGRDGLRGMQDGTPEGGREGLRGRERGGAERNLQKKKYRGLVIKRKRY
jgi:hypothetical protein